VDRETVWRVIAYARAESNDEVDRTAGIVTELLVEQSIDTIMSFDRVLFDLVARAYIPGLWAAAYIINYGTSDAGFEYFTGWLIARGQEIYEGALDDADSLADVVDLDDTAECESMLYVAQYAYERRMGREIPTRHRRTPPRDVTLLREAELPQLCPRLWAKFSA
jgi:hypothetical protein